MGMGLVAPSTIRSLPSLVACAGLIFSKHSGKSTLALSSMRATKRILDRSEQHVSARNTILLASRLRNSNDEHLPPCVWPRTLFTNVPGRTCAPRYYTTDSHRSSGDDNDDACITPLTDLLMSQYHSSALLVFGRLGLFDYIYSHQNINEGGTDECGVTAEQLASHANWSTRAASAMLISLASSGVLEVLLSNTDHPKNERYRLSPRTARFLVSDRPGRLNEYLNLFWDVSPQQLLDKASSSFGDSNSVMLETGRGTGAPSPAFIESMQAQTSYAAMTLAPLLDMESTQTFVDVGGGSGTFCIEACRANPSLRGIIYELPDVCSVSKQYVTDAGFVDRIETVPGNMFADQTFPPADCYAFGNVLHDWPEDVNRDLLTKAFASLPPREGMVVVLEMLVSEDVASTSRSAAGLNLVMVTNEQGRQYKASELERMLLEIGFVDVSVVSSPLTPYSAVVARKK